MEEALVAAAKAGDHAAFEQLVVENQNRIYTLCLRMTGDREEAQDLAQEAFLSAWRGLGSFKGESSFATWVYRLASNGCIDFLRSRNRRQAGLPTQSLEEGLELGLEPGDPGADPAGRYEARERLEALERGLQALPEHHRQVLVMRELSGMSYQEIGRALSLEAGTVKSRIARARGTLRKILLESGNFFESGASGEVEKHGKGGRG